MIAVRRLIRIRETKAAVVFEEEPIEGQAPLFGPAGRVYLSKAHVGQAPIILIKVQTDATSLLGIPSP